MATIANTPSASTSNIFQQIQAAGASTSASATGAPIAAAIQTQLESFGLFAVLIIALGSFQKTHMLAIYLLGFCALLVILKVAGGSY